MTNQSYPSPSPEEGLTDTTTPVKDEVVQERQDEPESIPLCIIKNFSTVWFTVCMDTGVLSVILHQFPYPSHWTRVCSSIMLVLTIVLSLAFGAVYLLRWSLFFKNTLHDVSRDPEEIALQACPAITWLTITEQVQLTAAESWGYHFTMLAFVMWWIGMLWILFILVMLYLHLINYSRRHMVDCQLPSAVFVPIVGLLTVGNCAGTIVNGAINATHISDTLAVPLIIIGFMCVGFALGIGWIMYAIYMHRLMISGWPEGLKIPAMILTIGPNGQAASALLQLGTASVFHQNFAHYERGYFLTADAANIVQVICTLAAILLVGFGLFWLIVDYYAIFQGLFRHKIHPSLFWWSSIFPVGTLVSALVSLGTALDSDAFRVFAVILFVFLFIVYLINWTFTIPMTLSGELLGLPKSFDLRLNHKHKHHHPWATFPRKHFTS